MKTEIINMTLLSAAFLSLFGLAEILYHIKKMEVEKTRKLVHLGTGLLTLLFPMVLTNHWQVLALCSSFIGILGFSLKYNYLPSINAIKRKSHGSLAYPVAVYGCYLAYSWVGDMAAFYLPILILAICDPVAALLGKRFPYGKYKVGEGHKTLMGSSMFFLSAMMVFMSVLLIQEQVSLDKTVFMQATMVALCATFAEGISAKGWDNLTIPASVLASLFLITKIEEYFHIPIPTIIAQY